MGLRHIGASPITSFTEQKQEARDCKLFYEHCKDSVLRDLDWTFARKRRSLASFTIPDDYEGKYTYGYVLPADCLKERKVYEPDGSVPQKFELWRAPTGEEFLMTDVENAVLRYTMRVTDSKWFDSEFQEALALKMASKLAIPLKKKRSLMAAMDTLYRDALATAKTSNVEEHDPKAEEDDTLWITERTA